MKIRCDRSELVEKLSVISGIVPSNSPKPILQDFLLTTRGGGLEVQANDLEVAGLIKIERVEVLEEGDLALPAAKLLNILRDIPQTVATIDFNPIPETRGTEVNGEGYEFKLHGHDAEEFPRISEIKASKQIGIVRETFVSCLKRVAVAASRDTTRYQLAGVFFELKGGKLTLTATDGKRLTNDHVKVEDKGKDKEEVDAIVPNRAVDVILKLLSSSANGGDEKFSLGFTDTDVVVRTGLSQINARLIEGTYPNYRNALPQDCPIKAKMKRIDLLSAAKGAQIMTDDSTSTVVFRFEADNLKISSQAKEGETKIQIKAEVEKGPLEIRFNPTYVIDALRCIDDEEVRIEFQSQDRPGVIRGGQHYRHMIMPLVIESR
jgi:DNA polymerase III subunit beta